jgi:hypothetical protein
VRPPIPTYGRTREGRQQAACVRFGSRGDAEDAETREGRQQAACVRLDHAKARTDSAVGAGERRSSRSTGVTSTRCPILVRRYTYDTSGATDDTDLTPTTIPFPARREATGAWRGSRTDGVRPRLSLAESPRADPAGTRGWLRLVLGSGTCRTTACRAPAVRRPARCRRTRRRSPVRRSGGRGGCPC